MLGYPDQALRRSQEAYQLAQELAHPHTLAWMLSHTALFHQFRHEPLIVQERAEAAVVLATDRGFPLWVAMGNLFSGWALSQQNQAATGSSQLKHGLAGFQATGTEILRPYHLSLLAELGKQTGQVVEGLEAVAEAQAVVDKTGERWCEAELYRLKGELTLRSHTLRQEAAAIEAEACFHQAIKIAQYQEAKSWELRAATSLARLWQSQGKTAAARALLTPVYNWFTEGFDTADLKEAKVLLSDLSEGQ